MSQLSLPAKMNAFTKLWKQFGSLSSHDEMKKKPVEKNISFVEMRNELSEYDDGLRWDQYGNPYIQHPGSL